MFFTIEAYKDLTQECMGYRLNKDGNWYPQKCFGKCNTELDMIFEKHEEARSWIKEHEMIINKTNIDATLSNSIDAKEVYICEVMTHRLTKPEHQLTKPELINMILHGDDRFNNSLIIDFNGYPRLIKCINSDDIRLTQNYAVRYETFNAGKGDVGSSSNIYYIDQIYVSLLEAWLEHLKTGRSIYTDYTENKLSNDEIINTINKLHIAIF
ncbi:hypothetical protein JOC70_000641 [Clostridium pascui]|uniref:hypothetical protein n=1 Tax=Clostridium pascui TaxID=46609 RepID=UPI00195DA3DC|nr:hypothetical protein [Clostridium pascui]MBM7869172.1 hypothetical protein [Clostridium pascui]